MFVSALLLTGAMTVPEARQAGDSDHQLFDELLDVNVRDGLVYYNALKSMRGRLDRYVAIVGQTSAAEYSGWARERQTAYWLNAYNAFVLRTVVDHYPIRGRAAQYPPTSIRQISGAFDKRPFRAAGRELTLDAIERDVLPGFGDPRLFLALGRGALGGGRLRSEAYTAAKLDTQLEAVAAESVTRDEIAAFDPATGVLTVSPIFSWREPEFARGYADKAEAVYASRSPVERAVLAFIEPHILASEREVLRENRFRVAFREFDWRLNDLTGGRRD